MTDFARNRRERRLGRWLSIFACLAMSSVLFLPTMVVLFVGLVPTYVAVVSDRSRIGLLTTTVGLTNMSGIIPLLFVLWEGEQSFDRAVMVIASPTSMLIVLAASGIGWMIFFVVPPIAARWAKMHLTARIKRLKSGCDVLAEVWGEDVRHLENDEEESFSTGDVQTN